MKIRGKGLITDEDILDILRLKEMNTFIAKCIKPTDHGNYDFIYEER